MSNQRQMLKSADPTAPLSMLNEQQKQFALFVAEGKTCATAARLAGYKQNKTQIEQRLMQNPLVIAAIRHFQKRYENSIVASRKRVLEGFLEAIEQAKLMSDPAVQIAGWREIGKMCGYYAPEVKEVHHTLGAKRVISQLEVMSDADLMRVIEQDSEIIEAEATQVLEVQDAESTQLAPYASEGVGEPDLGTEEFDSLRPADETELRSGMGAS